MVLRSIRMVVSLSDGKWALLNIRQYGPLPMCARERDLKIQHWALLHLHQHPASIC